MAAKSTQVITDLATAVATAPSATAAANAIAAAGPIMDLQAACKKLQLNAQEMVFLLNYLLGGAATTPAGTTSPTGGPITVGADSTLYTALAQVFNVLV